MRGVNRFHRTGRWREASGDAQGVFLPQALTDALDPSRLIIVENKIDLATESAVAELFTDSHHVAISALNGTGINTLRTAIQKTVEQGIRIPAPDSVLVSARHAEALSATKDALQSALDKMETAEFPELIATDLRQALSAMEAIVGKVDNERVLDHVFGSFCIGK